MIVPALSSGLRLERSDKFKHIIAANTIFAKQKGVDMAINQSITYQPSTEYKRVEAAVTREIMLSPCKIFPLACPVEELRWIPEWDYQLIYSKSGVNEANCIFNEDKSGFHFFEKPLTTTWITTTHEPDRHFVIFQINLDGKAVIRFEVRFREVAVNVSTGTWHMTFTALDDEANAMSVDAIRAKMELLMTFLADALKHYCETGEMLA
jgi:hypothetical protein